MQSLTEIAHQSLAQATRPQSQVGFRHERVDVGHKEKLANHIFKYMIARYGQTKFLKEFASGRTYTQNEFPSNPSDPRIGQDVGLVIARNAWGETLVKFTLETIDRALERMKTAHPTWPPSLNEFEILCDTCVTKAPMRRLTAAEEAQLAEKQALEREARQRMRAQQVQERPSKRRVTCAVPAPSPAYEACQSPLEALQSAAAAALAAHGMDEGQALRLVSEKITDAAVAAWAKGDWRGL